ncbi:hypothetical protein LOB45_09145 [Lactobacillus delbrueckii subsp. lactis]|nr:hypothetical protein [Lactobacillus delbrueckii subsp. lactis]
MTPNLTAFTGVDSQNLPDVMVSVQFILAIGEKNRVDEVIKYIISVTAPFQLMIYRITALYLHALLTDQKGKAQKIKKDMEAYGYGNAIASWPE